MEPSVAIRLTSTKVEVEAEAGLGNISSTGTTELLNLELNFAIF